MWLFKCFDKNKDQEEFFDYSKDYDDWKKEEDLKKMTKRQLPVQNYQQRQDKYKEDYRRWLESFH